MQVHKLKNKRVLVVGLGVTGASVVRFLSKHQVQFDVADSNVAHANLQATLAGLLVSSTLYQEITAQLCATYDVIVLSPGVPRASDAISAAIAAGVIVIGDIELFAGAVQSNAVQTSEVQSPIIAVTGSNGKSTVVSWLAHVLNSSGLNAVLCGNIGQPALDSLTNDDCIYVLELSSYQLESTQSLKASAAVVLNVSDDHMDRYPSLPAYAAVKRSVYRGCAHRVVNRDDSLTWLTREETGASATNSVATFSLRAPEACDYQIKQAANDDWLFDSNERVVRKSDLQLPGNHNVANALAVMALLEPFNISRDELARGLCGFRGLAHRTEFVIEVDGVRWYNDSKGTNIDACRKAIEAMPGPVVLIAGGQGKDADFSLLYSTVEKHVKTMVLIGQDKAQIAHALNGACEIKTARSMCEAVDFCRQIADSGDVVLLSPACASFDMFDNFEQRGDSFKQAVEGVAA